jgi:hypothetical protein
MAGAQLELPHDERPALADGLGEHRDERIADDDDVVVADRTAEQRLAVTRGAGIDLLLLSAERALPARVAAEHRAQLPDEVTQRPVGEMLEHQTGHGCLLRRCGGSIGRGRTPASLRTPLPTQGSALQQAE